MVLPMLSSMGKVFCIVTIITDSLVRQCQHVILDSHIKAPRDITALCEKKNADHLYQSEEWQSNDSCTRNSETKTR